MKKLLMILFLAIGLQAQTWGEQKLVFGSTFLRTDSLELKVSGMTDSLYSDTLYTEAIPISKSTGIYGVTAYLEEISGTSSSIFLDVRFLAIMNPAPQQRDFFTTYTPKTRTVRYSSWNNIGGTLAKNTLYTVSIAQADSSWWKPNYNALQYRLREADADTVLHEVLEFRDLEDTIK